MPREILNAQSRKLVLNVLEYFQNKKETTKENVSAIACAAEALKLSPRTISRIRHEGARDTMISANRNAPKIRDLSDDVKSQIRSIIYTMTAKKDFITREKLREELKQKHVVDVCTTTLGLILKDLGFRFRKDNGRRALMEQPHIASKRIHFLREYMKNAVCESPLDVVFLDETWIYQQGSKTLQTWNENTVQSVWNKSGSEGKRYVILHAGNKEYRPKRLQ
ncbi:hypothetical protein ABEB36_000067 [Hypothenemus hampei]|uniref:Transposase n=1 Tax=Hypothenemus hampei TaxID=57062 RepID=A0ABD1FA63_HYPHA